MLCVWLSKDWSIQENNHWNVWWKVGTFIGFIVVQNNGWAEQNQAAIQMSTYTGDNPNKDTLWVLCGLYKQKHVRYIMCEKQKTNIWGQVDYIQLV